ncbi:MAG: universal stress protein UspA [Polaromonas sp. 24-62-144]|jgi:nucleotide-binding universal stress UspA family protein|uniref:universal stress protein n=1 Tax=Polaromonas sp. TaxID=1869339 RepID=UPI000BD8B309|nr:universal stress protein [Polaromonas sp.]OYZ82043.1 MAG: universal stress protein UspA [Polaromonas sp. 24-62-144]HQS30991.1 universal stress protein [Polaromonas sp.]HQS90129.1 universal stress protein [Polaromonas sp.]
MPRVLVPVDGSPNSAYGVRHVVREFMKYRELDIHLLNVQAPFSSYVGRFASSQAQMAFHQEQSGMALAPARRLLNRFGISCNVHAEVGDTADCIADTARRLRCERIVMSSARKSSLVRWVEDSVINQVIERTTVPVEVIAGDTASNLERVGIPAGVGAGLLALGVAAM